MLKAVILDAATLGEDISFGALEKVTDLTVYPLTAPERLAERIWDAQVVIVNKVKLHEGNLEQASALKLICVTATGYDNIDLEYCRKRGIGVCNVKGYSTDSVAQVTVGLALELMMGLSRRHEYVRRGAYTASGVANCLLPAFHELAGKTWGIVGAGNIGGKVAQIAESFGCRVMKCRRTQPCVTLEQLCEESDIISIHTPLTPETRGLIGREQVARMKRGAIVINVARGAVTDESALAEGIASGHLGGLGIDVYSLEPLAESNPLYGVKDLPNVCLTPHMAWGAMEARQRCMDEIAENIRAFEEGLTRNRVDL